MRKRILGAPAPDFLPAPRIYSNDEAFAITNYLLPVPLSDGWDYKEACKSVKCQLGDGKATHPFWNSNNLTKIVIPFTKRQNDRGLCPIGVTERKNNKYKKFESRCSIGNGKRISLGYFYTKEEAFKAYKEYKEKYIRQVADEYKSKYPNFPIKLYEAMYNYEVEITD